MGEVPGNIDIVLENCPLKRERLTSDMPFIFVVPACGMDYTWFQIFNYVIDFMKSIIELNYVDEDRVYLSGHSMGGYTAWTMAFVHRNFLQLRLFAAVADFMAVSATESSSRSVQFMVRKILQFCSAKAK